MQIAPLWIALPQCSAGFVVARLPYILLPSHPNFRHAASRSPSPQCNSTCPNCSHMWGATPLPFLPIPLLEDPYPTPAALPPPLRCPWGNLNQQGHVEALLLSHLPCHMDLLISFKARIRAVLLLLRTLQQISPCPACSAPRASLRSASSLPGYQGRGH